MLTPDQLDLFHKLAVGREVPGGTFTSEQVRNFAAASFAWLCQLEGVGVPDEADVLAESTAVRRAGQGIGRSLGYSEGRARPTPS